MNNPKTFNLIASTCTAIAVSIAPLSTFSMQEGQLAPPEVKVVDEMMVSLTSGQIQTSLDTVAIGGELGLSHSISITQSNLHINRKFGYVDKFAGSVSLAEVPRHLTIDYGDKSSSGSQGNSGNPSQGPDLDPPQNYIPKKYVMRAFGPLGSQDFKIMCAGRYRFAIPAPSCTESNTTYEPLKDPRHSLKVSTNPAYQNHYEWTMPDGSRMYFRLMQTEWRATMSGSLSDVVYPNGLRIKVEPGVGLTTNTGFALKYHYVQDNSTLSDEDRATFNALPDYAFVPAIKSFLPNPDSGEWSGRNPKFIHALNLAVENCDNSKNYSDCSLSRSWPRAEFIWPQGSPAAFYLNDGVFSVRDADGATTSFKYEAQDISLDPSGSPLKNVRFKEGEKWMPRLVAIKTKESASYNYSYKYRNKIPPLVIYPGDSVQPAVVVGDPQEYPLLVSAKGSRGRFSYSLFQAVASSPGPVPVRTVKNWSRLNERYLQITTDDDQTYGNFQRVSLRDGSQAFYDTITNKWRNDLLSIRSAKGVGNPDQYFTYDDRGNLTEIHRGASKVLHRKAGYMASCASYQYRICNKPLWIENARGERTDFTYHLASGQVETITKPAVNGIRPQTRLKYEKRYAYFKQGSDAIQKADTGVYLLVEKSECLTSASVSGGCVNPSDEIKTVYEYGTDGQANNLHLTGEVVSFAGEVRRTCHQYNALGQRIGSISPNAKLASCP